MPIEKGELYDFLHSRLGGDLCEVNDDTPLLSSALLDSLALLDLLLFVESRLELKFSPGEITLANFDSIARIWAFCETKRTNEQSR